MSNVSIAIRSALAGEDIRSSSRSFLIPCVNEEALIVEDSKRYHGKFDEIAFVQAGRGTFETK